MESWSHLAKLFEVVPELEPSASPQTTMSELPDQSAVLALHGRAAQGRCPAPSSTGQIQGGTAGSVHVRRLSAFPPTGRRARIGTPPQLVLVLGVETRHRGVSRGRPKTRVEGRWQFSVISTDLRGKYLGLSRNGGQEPRGATILLLSAPSSIGRIAS